MNNKPGTILMTADTIGGVWTYALELTNALQPYGITVVLATMGEKLSRSQRRTVARLSNLVLRESDYALEWMDDPWDEIEEAGQWLLELEEQFRPDLIHLNNFVHGSLPWNSPVVAVGHSCVLSWWEAVHNEQAPPRWNRYAARVKEGLQQADTVVGVTRFMLDRLETYYGPFSSSECIYNARDGSRFNAKPKKPVVFSMGRLWDEAKNISVLQAISDTLSWPVYVAGEHRGNPSGETDNIHLLGRLNSREIRDWLAISGIFVLPAYYEPFGLSALEAAHSGCALVLSRIPSHQEVWGNAAMYADPGDPLAIRHQVESLILNASARQTMARRAMRRAKVYDTDRFARRYVDLYRKLLERRNAQMVAE